MRKKYVSIFAAATFALATACISYSQAADLIVSVTASESVLIINESSGAVTQCTGFFNTTIVQAQGNCKHIADLLPPPSGAGLVANAEGNEVYILNPATGSLLQCAVTYDSASLNPTGTCNNDIQSVGLVVTPVSNISSSGPTGGPFSPSSFSYQLSATDHSVHYSISGVPNWLSASSTSGTVGTSPVTVSFAVNGAANALSAGTYNTTITFTSQNGKGSQTRTASLSIASNIAKSTYVYSGPNFTYTALNGAPPGDASNLTGTVIFNMDTSNFTGWYGAPAPVYQQVFGSPLPLVSNPIQDITLQSGTYSGALSSSIVSSQGGPVFYFQNGVITQWFISFVSGQTVFLTENWPVYTEDSLFLGYPNGTNGTGEIGGIGTWTKQ